MRVSSVDDLSPRTIAITRSLIQPVQLQLDPLAMVDEVLARIIFNSPIDTPADYVAALDEALSSKAPLAALLPEYHPEVILRRFLAELRRRIVTPVN
jgi:hypothetical protein